MLFRSVVDADDLMAEMIDTAKETSNELGKLDGLTKEAQVYIILSIIPRLLCEKPPVMHVWINRIP